MVTSVWHMGSGGTHEGSHTSHTLKYMCIMRREERLLEVAAPRKSHAAMSCCCRSRLPPTPITHTAKQSRPEHHSLKGDGTAKQVGQLDVVVQQQHGDVVL